MKTKIKFKGLVIFYMIVACLTYTLILRVDGLERNNKINPNSIVINLW